ncbi:MAG: phosphoribosylformylglycinamidine synthase, partial [Geobacter sp.]
MAHRIEIALRDHVRDARGERIRREIDHFIHLPVEQIRTVDVYTVDAAVSDAELEKAASGPFCDPVIQTCSIDHPVARDFDFLVEVGFRAGVTDNVGRTAREAVEYITGRPFAAGEGVYTSVQYVLRGE